MSVGCSVEHSENPCQSDRGPDPSVLLSESEQRAQPSCSLSPTRCPPPTLVSTPLPSTQPEYWLPARQSPLVDKDSLAFQNWFNLGVSQLFFHKREYLFQRPEYPLLYKNIPIAACTGCHSFSFTSSFHRDMQECQRSQALNETKPWIRTHLEN